MDLQSFIQSGLLEAYALEQCTPDERAQVERMAAQYPEIRAELDAISASLEHYARAHSVSPPDWMKSSILNRIEQEQSGISGKTTTDNPRTSLRIFQILAFLLAAASSFLFLRQKDVEQENKQLQIRIDSLQQQLAGSQEQIEKAAPIAELLCDPETKRIIISDGKGLNSVVYYNPRLGRSAYDPSALPPLPEGNHYQFWAIVGGKPVNMGMVKDAASICETVRVVQNAEAFAFSSEPNPEGNPAPSTVLASGKV